MKLFLFFLLLFLGLVWSCNETVSDNKNSNHSPALFVIEYYELKVTNGDTILDVYFSREIKKSEQLSLNIELYGKDLDAIATIPLNSDSYKKKISIKLPLRDEKLILKFPDLKPGGNFMKIIRNHINGLELIEIIDFSMYTNLFFGDDRFLGDARLFRYEDLILFNPKLSYPDVELSEYETWQELRLANYSGKLDSKYRKQGIWVWKYGNGNILAQANFIDDSIQSPIVFYYYTGEIQDSIRIEKHNGKIYHLEKSFYRNGKMKQDDNLRYQTEFSMNGEVISHIDWKICDDFDITIFNKLQIETNDGRNYLIKDSLETIVFYPDISKIRHCFVSSEINGGTEFNFLPRENNGLINVRATMDSVRIEIKFSNFDTSITKKFFFPVRSK